MNNLVEVFRSDNTIEAQMKAQLLQQCGLSSTLLGENLASMIGMGGNAVPCRVLVPEEQAMRAFEILQTLETAPEEPLVEPDNCPKCNATWEPGFSVCWNCQAPLTD